MDFSRTDYHAALGQFMNYRLALHKLEPDRVLYLAIPLIAYEAFFQKEFAQNSLEFYQVPHVIYNPAEEVIVQWIS